MGFFDESMPTCQLGGLDLPVVHRKLSGGRATVDRRYPNRDGQSTEDMGREPYTFELQLAFFADVDATHYPDLWDQVRSLLEDPPDDLEYRDHELGTMHVSVKPWSSDLAATMRDGVMTTITLVEDDLDIGVAFRELRPQPNTESAGAALDDELEQAGVSEPNVITSLTRAGVGLSDIEAAFNTGTLWATMGQRFAEDIAASVIVSTEQIAATVDVLRARAQVLLELPELLDPANASAMHAAMLFAAAATSQGERAFADAAPVVEQAIADTISVFELSTQLYGDETRAEEIMLRNPGLNPLFIAAGAVIQVAAR